MRPFSFSSRRRLPLHERSRLSILLVFVFLPPLMVFIITGVIFTLFWRAGGRMPWNDWVGLAWCAVVLPLLAVGLPIVGLRELQCRQRR